MNDQPIKIISKTNNIQEISPIELKQKGDFRLVFKPIYIKENPNDTEAHLKGEFWYQRKGRLEKWEDYKTLDHSKLLKGQATKLELGSHELKSLYEYLTKLSGLFDKEDNIEDGEYLFVPNSQKIKSLIDWANKIENLDEITNLIKAVPKGKLKGFTSLIDIAHLEEVLNIWNTNQTNSDEEFWQKLFTDNSWILSQLFILPLIIVKDKAYVGGKTVENDGGKIVDYLYKNKVSGNISLIEIKTPESSLTGSEYRGVYSMSTELSGASVQLAGYKQTLLNDWNSTTKSFSELNAISPKCILIIGSLAKISKEQREAFELYRRWYKEVEIVTFDELFEKISSLIYLLKEGNNR